MAINWNNIRPLDNSQNEGFEELVCQLARSETIPNKKRFIRKGKPDAGVECFWVLENGEEWAWQAKFFTSSLGNNQWGQLDKSVRTVLKKHPNLKKYYIAIPNDPPDARLEDKQSMLDKWNDSVKKWKGWGLQSGLEVEFIPWWSSDLIVRLSKPANQGLTYFWFHQEEFTDEWLLENTQQAIADLGKRYTPNLHVDVDIAKVFDGISRLQLVKDQIQHHLDKVLIKGRKVVQRAPPSRVEKEKLYDVLEQLIATFNEMDFLSLELVPIDSFSACYRDVTEITHAFNEFYLAESAKPDDTTSGGEREKYRSEFHALNELESAAYQAEQMILSPAVRLANNPYLILEGEAGIGKSHLLADVITRRNENGAFSLFLLGQHFVSKDDPWTQIKKKLDVDCSFKTFLGALNAKAEANRQRLIIFIDAINEGKGKYFWPEHIRGFIQQLKHYPWLGLVVSVRTSYTELLVSEAVLPKELIIRCTHHGFSGHEYEASKLFFDNFGIELPSIPLLHPEFQNPLFLLLFCEGLSKAGFTRIPDGLQGMSDIIGFFVNSVNQRLSKPNQFNYPSNINIVEKAIHKVISYKASKGSEFIGYEAAYVELNSLSQVFGIKPGLLDSLISEGVFSKNLFWIGEKEGYQEGIYLAYERFEDYMRAQRLLEKHPNVENEFQENGAFYQLFKNEQSCYQNKGLLEAFSVLLPELTNQEFFHFVPYVKDQYPVIESFVQSLVWRKFESVNDDILNYINTEVLAYSETEALFLEVLISVCSNPEHYFNGAYFHQHLFDKTLAERDGWWTIYLKDSYFEGSAVKRLVDWAWSESDKSHIAPESLKLSSLMIAWFFTSTNRQLRDEATKALVSLLKNHIDVLVDVLKDFEGVNDPYVYERLFAVAYGCALTTDETEKLKTLSHYIFKTVFDIDNDHIYPHILLRDYARGVIEYTHLQMDVFDIDLQKVRPPYSSKLPPQFPSNEDIDAKYKVEYSQRNNALSAQNSILDSMTTEYGRGIGRYGDFGRYTFQYALSQFNVNPDEMSNYAVDLIFTKYGYDAELHGNFDKKIGSGRGRTTTPHERIGKKYQWMALHEILARVSDNCIMKSVQSWDDEEEPFSGPWEPFVRDIDPSMPLTSSKHSGVDSREETWWLSENYQNWAPSHQEWIKQSKDLPHVPALISVKDEEGNDWLVLEGEPEWTEPKKLGDERWKQARKRIWHQIRSYLVSEEDCQTLIDWAVAQDFMGRWMPEASGRYQVFDREYYWSPAFDYFNNYYYGGLEHHEVVDRKSDDKVCDATLTACKYTWEKDLDNSIEDTFNVLKPSKFLMERMRLIPTKNVAEYAGAKGNIVCFSPSVYNHSEPYLLIRKASFIRFLKEEKLKIVWTMLGEKNILGSQHDGQYMGRLDISGAYYLDDESEIKGATNVKLT